MSKIAAMGMTRFEGQAVIVTGGGSGIGQATAMAFAREGAAVAIGDLDETAAEAVARRIGDAGGQAIAIAMDATVEADAARLVARTLQAFGRLDHAFNNVGMSRGGTIETTMQAEWDWTMAVCLTSCWLGMKHQLPVMKAAGGGSIVNTASMAAKRLTVAPPAYSAAKAGVIQLTRCAAAEYASDGIRINSVSPGLVATPLIGQMFTAEQQSAIAREGQLIARAVEPDEIARAVLYLCSDDAAMVTGFDMEICGGQR